MSSKKKVQKEKDEAKAIKCHAFVLESDKAALIRANDYPLSSDSISINCGRPYGALDPLDWTASRAWFNEVPPLTILSELKQYADENLRSAADFSLPAYKLKGVEGDEKQLTEFARDNWTRRSLLAQWERDTVERLGSLTLYPKHSVSFTYSACGNHSVHSYSCSSFTLGAVIRRLIHAHCEWSNRRPAAYPSSAEEKRGRAAAPLDSAAITQHYKPAEDFQKLLAHSIRCYGFVTLKEQKDVTFNYVAPPRNGSDDDELEKIIPRVGSGVRTVRLTSHYDSTYINVCCGKNYYQLHVLDREKRRIKPLSAISNALELIYEDACAREASLLELHVSDEVREDLSQFYSLIARMSATMDDVDADIHRRLCEVSEVNAANLEILEGALFTVVVNGPKRSSERANEAQWLHSIFSLYFNWEKPDEFYASCNATVSSETLQLFLKRAMTGAMPSGRDTTTRVGMDQLSPSSAQDSAAHRITRAETSSPSFSDGQQGNLRSPINNAGTNPVGVGPQTNTPSSCPFIADSFQHVEFWLPQKHRTALRPYPPICVAPVWRERWLQLCSAGWSESGSVTLSVAEFCVAVVLAVERVLQSSASDRNKSRRPSVMFTSHNAACTVPSVVSLLTKPMIEYIQAIRSPSALLSPIVRREAKERAVESVKKRLQACVDEKVSLYALSRSAFDWDKQEAEPADVCLTFGLLSQEYLKQSGYFTVRSVCSELCVPARLLVNGTATQIYAQRHALIGDGAVCEAELGVTDGFDALANEFSAAFTAELYEMSTQTK